MKHLFKAIREISLISGFFDGFPESYFVIWDGVICFFSSNAILRHLAIILVEHLLTEGSFDLVSLLTTLPAPVFC